MVGDSGFKNGRKGWGQKVQCLDKWCKGWGNSARVRSKYAMWGQKVTVCARVVTEQEMGRDRARKGWRKSKKSLRQRFQGLVKWGRCGHMVQG